MFDLGWTEMALIAVVAVVVIGPKELPKVMREIGQWVAKARAMSRSFMDQLEEMSRDTGLDEVKKSVESIGRIDPQQQLKQTIDPDGIIERQATDLAKIGMPLEPALPKPEPGSDVADYVPPEAEATNYIGPDASHDPDAPKPQDAAANVPTDGKTPPRTGEGGAA